MGGKSVPASGATSLQPRGAARQSPLQCQQHLMARGAGRMPCPGHRRPGIPGVICLSLPSSSAHCLLKAARLLPECSLLSDSKGSLMLALPFPVLSLLGRYRMSHRSLPCLRHFPESRASLSNGKPIKLHLWPQSYFMRPSRSFPPTCSSAGSATDPGDAAGGAGLPHAAGTLCWDALASHRDSCFVVPVGPCQKNKACKGRASS